MNARLYIRHGKPLEQEAVNYSQQAKSCQLHVFEKADLMK